MRSSDYLFNLIQSLSKGERRNFKLFAQLQDGDKKYTRLFDAITKQKTYDEKKLLTQFKGERFTKQFSVAKNYLYNYLLKTLVIFQKDQQSELTNLLNQVRVLISKNLFQQAHKLVRKAKLIAERQERFPELLELLAQERLIYKQTKKIKEFRAFITMIQSVELETLGKMKRLIAFEHLYDEIQLVLGKSEESRSKSDLESFAHIMENDLIKKEGMVNSIRAKIRKLDILIDIHRYSGDFGKSLEMTEKVIEVYDQNPSIKRDDNLRYIISLSNLAIFYYSQRRNLTTSQQLLEKLKNTETFSPQEKLRVMEKYYHFSLALAIQTGNEKLGYHALEELEANLAQVEGKIRKTQELGIYYSSAYFYLQNGKVSQSKVWLDKVLNEPKTEMRTDLQAMARVMEAVIQYELGNFDLIENFFKSANRFLAKKDRMYGYEKSILRMIKRLSDTYGTYGHPKEMEKSYIEIQEVLKDPFELKAKGLFDALVWIDSKLQQTTMAQVIANERVLK